MPSRKRKSTGFDPNPTWYKDAIIYELHVRAFSDSDADGIGDFRGLRDKLDYLQDLGVTALWLLPFYPSPLRDDGYDIADYTRIHESYGTMREFKAFLREAHKRGLRVINELVINHTSDQHRWFQRARRARPGSRWRNYYVWSDTSDRYPEARIIFKDFENSNWTWDPVANAYFWHRFYSHQPDLNFDNPEIHQAIFNVMDFWIDLGVDGMRLDAIPYLYERDDTNCENLPETHTFLKLLRRHLDTNYEDRMFLAEANQWPEDSVAYFGEGDECHVAFHFPLMPRLFMAIQMEDRFPVLDILDQTPAIPESTQWAIFLRNHDELTLEMVTDEERDYMYRVYAEDQRARINLGIRRRLAPLLGNNRRKIELMNGLLLSLPGTPVLYYGDEIGMGDNIYLGDRNGVRTPMQWSSDRNAGFSRANPQQLYLPVIIDPEYHYETVNVEAQQNNTHSLLWWMKRLIAMRKQYKAFGRGDLEFLQPENRRVLAFTRSCEDELLLMVFNLSRFTQYVELDLARFNGMVPVELFGRTPFPPIGELPYFITLSPHAFYWFALEPQEVAGEPVELSTVEEGLPSLAVVGVWDSVFRGRSRSRLEDQLPGFLMKQRWFGGKARTIRQVAIQEAIPIRGDGKTAQIVLLDVDYSDGDPERYLLPLAFSTGERAEQLARHTPQAVLARLTAEGGAEEGVLADASLERDFAVSLMSGVVRRRRWKGLRGEASGSTIPGMSRADRAGLESLEPALQRGEQSNTSILYGDRFILKLFRRVETGVNPDLEIGRFLTRRGFKQIPPVAGALEYKRGRSEPATLAVLHTYIASEGDAWQFTLDSLGRYYETVLTLPEEERSGGPKLTPRPLLARAAEEIPEQVHQRIDPYFQTAELLGRRSAEMHLALASDASDPAFAPEPLTRLRQRAIAQSLRSSARRTLQALRRQLKELPEPLRAQAVEVLDQESELLGRIRSLAERKIDAELIRCHGDFHLGQLLFTGKDFIILDFEGEPARPIGERRLKRSPMRDVAGMVRSFDYAAHAALRTSEIGAMPIRPEDQAALEPWARYWSTWVTATYLKSYLATVGERPFLPASTQDRATMLDAYLLEKAVYEIAYELNNRPTWVSIPLQGILDLLAAGWEA